MLLTGKTSLTATTQKLLSINLWIALAPCLIKIFLLDKINKRSSTLIQNKLSFILFADDSNWFFSHSDLTFLTDTVNSELKSVVNWFRANKLSLNISKTCYMLFSNTVCDLPRKIMIDDSTIVKTDCCKFLGLYIDSRLTWRNHIDYLCKIISRNIGVLNKIKQFLPDCILESLYNTLVVSYINYGILAWGNSPVGNLNRLYLLQKRALRVINFANFDEHTDPFFMKHKTLKLTDMYNFQLGSLMYQSARNLLPPSINTIFTQNCEIHSHFTRQVSNYHIPFSRTSFAQNTVKYRGPKLWNSLSRELKASTKLSSFKRLFKSTLLQAYY